MKYGKDTEWLKGIKIGEEPEELNREQLARRYILLERIQDHLLEMGRVKDAKSVQEHNDQLDIELLEADVLSLDLDPFRNDPYSLSYIRAHYGGQVFPISDEEK
ncbi:MAG: hypothetical protein IH948_10750 [Bacteroidetes bacterium]|nr:hypothetical protein [Bacteroidota bacterium]